MTNQPVTEEAPTSDQSATEEKTVAPAQPVAEEKPVVTNQSTTTQITTEKPQTVQTAEDTSPFKSAKDFAEKALAKSATAAPTSEQVDTAAVEKGVNVKDDLKTYSKIDADEALLGVAQGFHIFAKEANLNAHTDGNIAVGKLFGNNQNIGTNNNKGDSQLYVSFGDLSYIQSIETGATLNNSMGVASRDSLLVVGKDLKLGETDNGSSTTINGTKISNLTPDQIKAETTTYIDFEKEFSNLIAISKELASGEHQTIPVTKGTYDNQDNFHENSNYELDLKDAVPDATNNNRIVLNLNAADFGDQAGEFIIKNIPKDAIVVINVKSDKDEVNIMKKIVLQYEDVTKRENKETENFSDSTLLWNFATIKKITLNSPFQGSILAPEAELNGGNQNIDGSIIVHKFYGAGETHRWDFQGTKDGGFVSHEFDKTPEPSVENPDSEVQPENPGETQPENPDSETQPESPGIETQPENPGSENPTENPEDTTEETEDPEDPSGTTEETEDPEDPSGTTETEEPT